MEKKTVYQLNDEYLKRILSIHFDRNNGSPYWLEKAKEKNIDVLSEINSFEVFKDLFAFKTRNEMAEYEDDLRTRQLEDFIPRSVKKKAPWIWASETGGTTGIAKRGTWGSQYWDDILDFSNEFLDLHGVPKNENWLFIGPTGPHTTGRLLISIAENRGGMIYCIDMDPRIVRLYLAEGNEKAVQRYVEHLWEQVVPIIKYQNIGVVFCTASLLELLPQYVDVSLFEKVKAVTHAGLAMSRDTYKFLKEDLFPNKPVVGIYGTSVSGISFQKPYEKEDDYRIIYIPSQPFISLEAINEDGTLADYDKQGDVRCFRFTEDSIIPGFIERDKGIRIKPFGKVADRYNWDWICDIQSPASLSGQKMEGVY
ncbi:thienamycin biosynthesis protein ThnN [Anaerobacterium chartisolvens]|uniref:Thienamycin biosynthesis protein ThnN n=1 Tax=Anaerobacterium chartisolvens TaxID=1297424 RepID=A0A369B4E9_9FIRM|nr:AMP-dependent synthetase [Anaerobacterium chartisolvens]RCX16321.1 thienamycin biosynthesis protein ThnN [Anaerobacterium chartisolvens]